MVNLKNILPISKAASSLAALIKKAKSTGEAIIITQKGYPSGVLLSVETFNRLRGAAGTPADQAPCECGECDECVAARAGAVPEVYPISAIEHRGY